MTVTTPMDRVIVQMDGLLADVRGWRSEIRQGSGLVFATIAVCFILLEITIFGSLIYSARPITAEDIHRAVRQEQTP